MISNYRHRKVNDLNNISIALLSSRIINMTVIVYFVPTLKYMNILFLSLVVINYLCMCVCVWHIQRISVIWLTSWRFNYWKFSIKTAVGLRPHLNYKVIDKVIIKCLNQYFFVFPFDETISYNFNMSKMIRMTYWKQHQDKTHFIRHSIYTPI